MLDIHQLNVFLVAAETLNFTQAARQLHMSQPSVSQHIQGLEKHFKETLFIRSGRNIELTDAGLELVPLAREAVRLSTRIEETMASSKGEIHGHLHVGCSTTPGKYLLPHILAQFHQSHPFVRATCHVVAQTEALQKVIDGDVHFSLASLNGVRSPELEFHRFYQDEILLVVPNGHSWATLTEIEPQDLYREPFILREEGSGSYEALRVSLAEVGVSVKAMKTLLTLGNSEAITIAIQEGLGIGFISELLLDRLGQGQITPVKIRGVSIQRDIYITRHARRPATAAQTAFWDFIHSDSIKRRYWYVHPVTA
jgi:DNA-binding transcriptional LysR family regulator